MESTMSRRYSKGAAVAVVAGACAACGTHAREPPPLATPIGRGPAFLPTAPEPPHCAPGRLAGRFRAHVEIFARRRVVILPAGIGVGRPRRLELGHVVDAPCRAAVRTPDPSGVVEFDSRATLRDLFAAWRMPLSPTRLLSFRGRVFAYVDGRRRRGDPRSIELRDGGEIVLEVGGYVPPHRSYLFPPR
jgi:hypothetical protein